MRLDQLARIKEEAKALIQARPKLAYKIFGARSGLGQPFNRINERFTRCLQTNPLWTEGRDSKYFNYPRFLARSWQPPSCHFQGRKMGRPKRSVIWMISLTRLTFKVMPIFRLFFKWLPLLIKLTDSVILCGNIFKTPSHQNRKS